jgi:hypothetical protein
MSTPEGALPDSTVRIGLLLEAVEAQRALGSRQLQALQQLLEGLDEQVRAEIRLTLTEELRALSEEGQRTAAALRAAARALTLRQALSSALLASLCVGLPLLLCLKLLPSPSEVAALAAARTQLGAQVTRLAQQGGRTQLARCGAGARLCVRIDRTAPFYGEHADFAVLLGY